MDGPEAAGAAGPGLTSGALADLPVEPGREMLGTDLVLGEEGRMANDVAEFQEVPRPVVLLKPRQDGRVDPKAGPDLVEKLRDQLRDVLPPVP